MIAALALAAAAAASAPTELQLRVYGRPMPEATKPAIFGNSVPLHNMHITIDNGDCMTPHPLGGSACEWARHLRQTTPKRPEPLTR